MGARILGASLGEENYNSASKPAPNSQTEDTYRQSPEIAVARAIPISLYINTLSLYILIPIRTRDFRLFVLIIITHHNW